MTLAGARPARQRNWPRARASGAFFNSVLATVLALLARRHFGPAWASLCAACRNHCADVGAVAVGPAAPCVDAQFSARLAQIPAKAGAWMEKFKIAMGFPMLAAALWLLSASAGTTAPRA